MYRFTINVNNKKGKINKEIYGHFSEHLGRCIYEGLFVGKASKIPNKNGMRSDVVTALKDMKLSILRWPGGCFADEYHWKDGIGEQENRKKMINTHWGGVLEDNSFGTHEFLELCEQVGCEPYINGNLGSGTVQEMSEWIEYMNFDGISPMAVLREKNGRKKPWNVRYFAVGNENWGCGGNMTPQYYANEYRRYQTYLRNYGENKLYKVACGACVDDYAWTEELMKSASRYMDGLSLHHYTFEQDWNHKGVAVDFDEQGFYSTLKNALYMEELIDKHAAIMDKYDPGKKVALVVDEWGCWHKVEEGTNPGFLYQQNTMRDALVAGLTLNIFNQHCDRVKMANIAQIVNVLQSVILTEGDKMVLTPTYHIFKMYSCHQEAELLESFLEKDRIGAGNILVDNLSESVSLDENGNINITIANLSLDKDYVINTEVSGRKVKAAEAEILTGKMNAHNTFEAPATVGTKAFKDYKLTGEELKFTIPACSVIHFMLEACHEV